MDNKQMKLQTAGSIVLYILSAVMLFLDWFALPLGTLQMSLLEVKDNFSFVSDSAGIYITIALILAGVAILVAIVGAVEKKRSYGIGAAVITGAMLIAALIVQTNRSTVPCAGICSGWPVTYPHGCTGANRRTARSYRRRSCCSERRLCRRGVWTF